MITAIFRFITLISFINLILLNYLFFKNYSIPVNNSLSSSTTDISIIPTLTAKIASLETAVTRLSTVTTEVVIIPTTKPLSPKVSRHISYLPINGSFSQLTYTWLDASGAQFYFDTADYPGLKEVRFDANLKLVNGNGLAMARLYDVTHAVALPGSEVQTGSQQDTLVTSSPVNFLAGRNLIRVQIKSLTADTTVFNSGRLVITSEY